MTPRAWQEADRLLDDLLNLPEPERRRELGRLSDDNPDLAAVLRRAFGDDPGVRPVEERFAHLLSESVQDEPPKTWERHDPPSRIGAYRVLGRIAEGGMGTVYRAQRADGAFEQTVALKVLRCSGRSPDAEARFVQERQLLARLQHPGIARILDGGLTPDGELYFAMEYIEGQPIDSHCDDRRLTIAERLHLFDQVLEAVHFAHRNLVLHRDLKPSNILVTVDGEAKLLDFGIAKVLDAGADGMLTQAGDLWLTPDFASPEQVAGEPVSTSSDVYSLGVLLFVLLTGLHPFHGRSGAERRRSILEGGIPGASAVLGAAAAATIRVLAAKRSTRPAALASQLASDLDAILTKATRREAEDRYPSVELLRSDLRRYRTGHPVEAARGSRLYAARKFWRRHRLAVTGAATVCAALTVGIGVAVHQARVARLAEARAGAINRFLTEELLGSASPEIARGRELTVAEVVSAAELNLQSLGRHPDVEGSIRRTLAQVRLRLGDHDRARSQIGAAERVLAGIGGSGGELAALRRIGAELSLAEGDLDGAIRLAEDAVALAERELGRSELATLEARVLLGRVQSARWESIAAEETLRDAATRLDRRHPEATRARWAAKRSLAEALVHQTRRTEAIELLREILAQQEATLGPAHPEVGRTCLELAGPLARLRFHDEAQALARRALTIFDAAFGAAHPETQRARYELGSVLMRCRKEDEAVAIFEDVLAVGARSGRDPDLAVVGATNALGVARARQDRWDEAVGLYRTALEDAERLLGPSHETTSMIRRNLSNRLATTGRRAEALELAREVRRVALVAVEERYPDPMYLANNAWFLSRGAELEEARDLDAALALAERAVEISGGRWSYPLISLQDAHRARGELDQAIAASKRALALPDALHLWGDESLLVDMLVEVGDLDGAERFLRQHLERRRLARGGDDALAGHTRGLLGRVLLLRDRLHEAAGQLETALSLLEGDEGEVPRWRARALSDLGAVRERQGDLAAAREHLLLAVEGLGAPSTWRRDWSDEHELAQRRLDAVSTRLRMAVEASASPP